MAQSSTARKKVIIGIHGLANKPEKKYLEPWWKSAILEGLEKIAARKMKKLNLKCMQYLKRMIC